jgi:hypothetical protein
VRASTDLFTAGRIEAIQYHPTDPDLAIVTRIYVDDEGRYGTRTTEFLDEAVAEARKVWGVDFHAVRPTRKGVGRCDPGSHYWRSLSSLSARLLAWAWRAAARRLRASGRFT